MLGTIGPGSEGCDEEGNVAFGGMKVLDPGTPGRGGGLVSEAGGRCLATCNNSVPCGFHHETRTGPVVQGDASQ